MIQFVIHYRQNVPIKNIRRHRKEIIILKCLIKVNDIEFNTRRNLLNWDVNEKNLNFYLKDSYQLRALVQFLTRYSF